MRYFLIILLCVGLNGYAQPSDTSYTIHSTFIKESKIRPYIKVASPAKAKWVRTKSDIVYRQIGERKLTLDVFYPKRKRSLGIAVLLIYGGGWKSGDKSLNKAMAIDLANHGIVAVSAEYRLSPEAKYPAAVYDLKAAIRWMRAHANEYNIDSSEIVVLGCSAGGQLAALIGTTNMNPAFEDPIGSPGYSSKVQAVIDMDGILAFKHPESEEGASASLWLNGNYEQSRESWESASALNHVDINSAPILFINSSLPRFHAGRDDMIKKLDALGIFSAVHTMNDSPHSFWFFDPWFEPMMKYVKEFIMNRFHPFISGG